MIICLVNQFSRTYVDSVTRFRVIRRYSTIGVFVFAWAAYYLRVCDNTSPPSLPPRLDFSVLHPPSLFLDAILSDVFGSPVLPNTVTAHGTRLFELLTLYIPRDVRGYANTNFGRYGWPPPKQTRFLDGQPLPTAYSF